MYNTNEEILVITNRTGYIPQMRMCGPILQPIKVPVQLCLSMVCAGVELYQVDPVSMKNMKLTPLNLMDDTKFETKIKPAEEPVIPVVSGDVTPTIVQPITVNPEVASAPIQDAENAIDEDPKVEVKQSENTPAIPSEEAPKASAQPRNRHNNHQNTSATK